jgi:polyhydroxybutyrate depolymerase
MSIHHRVPIPVTIMTILSLLTSCGAARAKLADNAQTRIVESITVDGIARRYTLVLPTQPPPSGAYPLIIAMHGGGGSAAQFEASSLLTPKADVTGYALVYPDGSAGALGLQTWNGGECCGYAADANIDDVEFVREMVKAVSARHPIDPRRIYATGHSNGAIMAYRLACEAPDLIAAIAPNAGPLMTTACAPTRPVPVLHMHSKLDANVPYQGGFGIGISGVAYPSLEATMQTWVRLNACDATPITQVDPGRYTRVRWTGCATNASVEYVLTDDGGHSWPGGTPGRPGGDPPSSVLNANDAAIAFFDAHALPLAHSVWLPQAFHGRQPTK